MPVYRKEVWPGPYPVRCAPTVMELLQSYCRRIGIVEALERCRSMRSH